MRKRFFPEIFRDLHILDMGEHTLGAFRFAKSAGGVRKRAQNRDQLEQNGKFGSSRVLLVQFERVQTTV